MARLYGKNPYRPKKNDERMFKFKRLQIYLHYEARNKAQAEKQNLLWSNYMQQLTEEMMENEIPEDEARNQFELE
jgi:hypothetical protein